MTQYYEENVEACAEAFQREDHRAFFSINDVPGSDGTDFHYSSGVDMSRLLPRQADLLQLLLLSRHLSEVARKFDVPERDILRIARSWDVEAAGDIRSVLEDNPHPLKDAPANIATDTSEFKIDERLE